MMIIFCLFYYIHCIGVFSFQIVGFKSRSSVVVKCFESREEDECDIIFKTEDVRNFPEVIPKKIKMKKKAYQRAR